MNTIPPECSYGLLMCMLKWYSLECKLRMHVHHNMKMAMWWSWDFFFLSIISYKRHNCGQSFLPISFDVDCISGFVFCLPGYVSPSNEIYRQPKVEMSSSFSGIHMNKSEKFSYEELANATNDFNMSNKIGEGGFGAVYYAEIRGEVCYIIMCLSLIMSSFAKCYIIYLWNVRIFQPHDIFLCERL